MATRVHMEALSPTMEEGQLVRWFKSEGDDVVEGDILAEIETDKATMELVARGSGVLRKIGLAEGGVAKVGEVIGVIAALDEDIAALLSELSDVSVDGQRTDTAVDETAVVTAATGAGPEAVPTAAERAAPDAEPLAGVAADVRVKASPLARRLASEAGVALDRVTGTGPGGRIIKRDVEAAAASPIAPVAPAIPAGPEFEDVPVSQMRKTIAKRLVTSIGPVPTFYLTIDVDMTRLLAARAHINRTLESRGAKVSINDLLVKAIAVALSRHPEVNSSWAGDVIRRHHRVHIGVAVAVEDGLITPVIRDADRKGTADIASEIRDLAGRARDRKLKPEEYTGATFSISNLGMFGIDEFTAVINPPESGIIAVGQVEERVVAEEGQPVVKPRMRMTMSCDHRVVDGATGARFLQTVRAFLEEPAMMLV